jgi:hypothetical protein
VDESEVLVFTVLNPITGEIKSQSVVRQPEAKKARKKRQEQVVPFAALFFNGAEKLRQVDKIQGFDYDLFLYLWTQLRYHNYLTIKPSDLARKLGVNRVQVQRSLRKFKESQVLYQGADGITYRMSPNIGYRGTRDEQNRAIDQLNAGTFLVVDGGPIDEWD